MRTARSTILLGRLYAPREVKSFEGVIGKDLNLVLVALPQPVWDGLVAEGYSFSRRGAPSEGVVRIACAFDTTPEAVDALIATAERYAGMQPAVESAAAARPALHSSRPGRDHA